MTASCCMVASRSRKAASFFATPAGAAPLFGTGRRCCRAASVGRWSLAASGESLYAAGEPRRFARGQAKEFSAERVTRICYAFLAIAAPTRHASTPPAAAHGVRRKHGTIRACRPSGRKTLACFRRGRPFGPLGAKSYSWTPQRAPNTHRCPRASLLDPRRTPRALVSDQPRTRRAAPTPRRAALRTRRAAAAPHKPWPPTRATPTL